MVGMRQQGAWTKWESVQQCKITWAKHLESFHRINVLVQTDYDFLPSPKSWRVQEAGLAELVVSLRNWAAEDLQDDHLAKYLHY